LIAVDAVILLDSGSDTRYMPSSWGIRFAYASADESGGLHFHKGLRELLRHPAMLDVFRTLCNGILAHDDRVTWFEGRHERPWCIGEKINEWKRVI